MSLCTTCNIEITPENTYKRSGRPGKLMSRCKSCFNSYCVDRWRKRKIKAIENMGNKCHDCENTFPFVVYDFHHLDPNEKEFDWSKMRLVSEEKLQRELEKCILLCSNCHRIRHVALSN